MITRLRDKHCGQSISIIGSGPSAALYDGRGDVSIGVNGAALLGPKFDYFLAGDHHSYRRDWFAQQCSTVRVIAEIVATMDYQLYPENLFPELKRMAVANHEHRNIPEVPPPVPPHLVYRYWPFRADRISKHQTYLMYKGTISCCALQLANIMGATAVDIFGCDFTHSAGSYFYEATYRGRVCNSQQEVMQETINVLRTKGVAITIHGQSKLQ